MATVAGYRRVVMCQEARDEARTRARARRQRRGAAAQHVRAAAHAHALAQQGAARTHLVGVTAAVTKYVAVTAVAKSYAGSGWYESTDMYLRQPGTLRAVLHAEIKEVQSEVCM